MPALLILSNNVARVSLLLLLSVCLTNSADASSYLWTNHSRTSENPQFIPSYLHGLTSVIRDDEFNMQHATKNGTEIDTICEAYARVFADAAANYTRCFIVNARPMNLCVKCVTHYLHVNKTYEDLRQMVEDRDIGIAINKQRCEDWVLNADRIMAIQRTRAFFENLWTMSHCPNCFSSYTEPPNLTDIVAPHVTKFKKLSNSTVQCFMQYRRSLIPVNDIVHHNVQQNASAVCTSCKPEYEALSVYYELLDKDFGSSLCMDIVDSMNYTRREWGHEFGCSGNTPQDGITITITVLFFILPAVFYITSKLHYQRIEQKIVKQKRMRHASAPNCAAVPLQDEPSEQMLYPVSHEELNETTTAEFS